jgi:replicative DNA helicase
MTSPNYEVQILGAIKLNQNIIDDYALTDSIFLNSKHKQFFNIMNHIHNKGKKIDLATVYEEIKNTDLKISDYDSFEMYSDANVQFYIDQQKETWRLEKLSRLSYRINDMLKDTEALEIVQQIDKDITDLVDMNENDNVLIRECLIPALNQIEEAYKAGGKIRGISTGFNSIDTVTNGFQDENLIIIGARTGIGKTSISLKMAYNIAKRGDPVGYYSLEMSKIELTHRLMAMETNQNLSCLLSGKMRYSDFNSLTEISEVINKLPLYINDTPNLSLMKFKAKARQLKRRGVKIIFVDHITLFNIHEFKMPKNEAIGEVSRNIKNLARELKIPIVVLSQLKREAENKKPTLSDLRWSGDIEENADQIIFLHRKRDESNKEAELETEIIVAKNRNGANDIVKLIFEKKYTLYKECNDYYHEDNI